MQPTVAVWAYIMATTILLIGFFLIMENIAAENKARGLRDQMRTLILLASLFAVAWWITGNSWLENCKARLFKVNMLAKILINVMCRIISPTFESFEGITSLRGMIPEDCKNGDMGDRGFYQFLLAIIIILDVLIPTCGTYVIYRTFLSRTFSG